MNIRVHNITVSLTSDSELLNMKSSLNLLKQVNILEKSEYSDQ